MVRRHLFSQKSFVLLHTFHELILKLMQSEVTHTWYVHSFVNDGLTSRWFVFCCCSICSCYTGTEWEEICHLKIVKLSELIFCINYEAKWVSGDDLWFCCVYIWKSTVFGFWNKYINIVFFWRSWFSLNSNLNHDSSSNYCMTSGCRAQVFLDMFMMLYWRFVLFWIFTALVLIHFLYLKRLILIFVKTSPFMINRRMKVMSLEWHENEWMNFKCSCFFTL